MFLVNRFITFKYIMMNTRNFISFGKIAVALLITISSFAQKEKTTIVGGAAMYPSKNIIENAVK